MQHHPLKYEVRLVAGHIILIRDYREGEPRTEQPSRAENTPLPRIISSKPIPP